MHSVVLADCTKFVALQTFNAGRVISPSDCHSPRDPYEILGLQLSNATAGMKVNHL